MEGHGQENDEKCAHECTINALKVLGVVSADCEYLSKSCIYFYMYRLSQFVNTEHAVCITPYSESMGVICSCVPARYAFFLPSPTNFA